MQNRFFRHFLEFDDFSGLVINRLPGQSGLNRFLRRFGYILKLGHSGELKDSVTAYVGASSINTNASITQQPNVFRCVIEYNVYLNA